MTFVPLFHHAVQLHLKIFALDAKIKKGVAIDWSRVEVEM
jgi:hypothetical protein